MVLRPLIVRSPACRYILFFCRVGEGARGMRGPVYPEACACSVLSLSPVLLAVPFGAQHTVVGYSCCCFVSSRVWGCPPPPRFFLSVVVDDRVAFWPFLSYGNRRGRNWSSSGETSRGTLGPNALTSSRQASVRTYVRTYVRCIMVETRWRRGEFRAGGLAYSTVSLVP